MYFSETPSLREIEKTMKMIPNFTPRGHGVVILCKHEFAEENCIGVSQKERLARTMSQISNPLFQKRLKKYINESETIPMNFRNSKHNITFTDTIRKKNKKDYALTEFCWRRFFQRILTDARSCFASSLHHRRCIQQERLHCIIIHTLGKGLFRQAFSRNKLNYNKEETRWISVEFGK